MVVGTPIGDILAGGVCQQIERVPGLLQSRTEPTDRTFPARASNRVERIADDLRLFVGWHFIETDGISLIVPHPFPMALLAFFDNFRVVETDIAVQRNGCPNSIPIENFHDAKNADLP